MKSEMKTASTRPRLDPGRSDRAQRQVDTGTQAQRIAATQCVVLQFTDEAADAGELGAGPSGNDYLEGGKDFDTYKFAASDWGADLVLEADGQGRVQLGTVTLGACTRWNGTSGRRATSNSRHAASRQMLINALHEVPLCAR